MEFQLQSRPRWWSTYGFGVFLLVLLNIALFGDALFTPKTFFVRDVSFFHYPLKWLVTEAWARGEWPLWNPYIQLGQPLLANPNAMALYPTQLFFQLLPFELAFELHFALHCLVAGLSVLYLGRELGLGPGGAFLAAALYNLSGITLSAANMFNILPIVTFLPLLSLVLASCLSRYSAVKLAAAALLFGAFFLLLEPLSSLATALFLLPFLGAFYYFSSPPRPAVAKVVAVFLLLVTSGLLLASVQILPTLELIENSGRRTGLGFEVVSAWSWHPLTCLQLVLPEIFGDYFRFLPEYHWGSPFFEGREPYLYSCYLGLASCLMAGLGILYSAKPWVTRLLAVLTLIALILAMGKYTPVYQWLFETVPLFRFGRYPVKYLFVVNLCVALLAGFGLEGLRRVKESVDSGRARWAGIRILGGVTLILLGVAVGLSWESLAEALGVYRVHGQMSVFTVSGHLIPVLKTYWVESMHLLQWHAAIFLIVLGLIRWKALRWSLLQGAVISLIVIDLLTNNLRLNPLMDSDLYEPAPAARFIKQALQGEPPYRIYSFQGPDQAAHPRIVGRTDAIAWVSLFRKLSLFPFLSAKDHLQYSVFVPIDMLETLPSQVIYRELRQAQSMEDRIRFLAGLNVRFIASTREIVSPLLTRKALFELNSREPLRIYELNLTVPRALLVSQEAAAEETPSYQDMLSVGGGLGGGRHSDVLPNGATPDILEYGAHRITLEATAERDCLLVLLDGFYPGWRATLDDSEIEIRNANHLYRGIEFPAGTHRVVFTYVPQSFRIGLSMTLAALLSWCFFLAFSWMRVWKKARTASTERQV